MKRNYCKVNMIHLVVVAASTEERRREENQVTNDPRSVSTKDTVLFTLIGTFPGQV